MKFWLKQTYSRHDPLIIGHIRVFKSAFRHKLAVIVLFTVKREHNVRHRTEILS